MPTETLFKLEYTVSEDEKSSVSAVIVAAGRSERMLGNDKILADLRGKSVLEYSLDVFCGHTEIDSVIVVASKRNMLRVQEICGKYSKVTDIIEGGSCRGDSVAAGFSRVRTKFVLIHDGARPFVTRAVIDRVLEGLNSYPAVAPAVPLNDTVKEVDDRQAVRRTFPRESLRAIQTPQGFDSAVYGDALDKAGSLVAYTDDCSIVESSGIQAMCVEGDKSNIKITEPRDLKIAAALLGS